MSPVAETTVLRWSGRGLERASGERAGALLAADSWLVVDGAVRALEHHVERFCRACGEVGTFPARAFCGAVADAVPAAGRWFPRVELTAAGELLARVRPAPAADATALRVAVAPPGDPRAQPLRKGPDLELLLALRARSGAGELLLRDGHGALLEGALSSLLWWERDVLCTTPADRTLAGVTRALVIELARSRGIELGVRAPRPEELAGREAWLTSALHGIRPVGAWLSPAQPAGPAERAADWQAALEALR